MYIYIYIGGITDLQGRRVRGQGVAVNVCLFHATLPPMTQTAAAPAPQTALCGLPKKPCIRGKYGHTHLLSM